MQIRLRNYRMEFLRSHYEPTSKRSRQKLIGSMSAWSRTIPNYIQEVLKDEELNQLQEYLNDLIAREEASAETNRIESALSDLHGLAKSVSKYSITDNQAIEIKNALQEVEKEINKIVGNKFLRIISCRIKKLLFSAKRFSNVEHDK